MLEEFFEACVEALRDTPAGPPDCAYIAEGPPPWDACPCLIVWAGGPATADTLPLQPMLSPGHRAESQGMVNLVSITATVLRCSTLFDDSGHPPQPAQHAAVAEQTSADVWAIRNHVRAAKKAETLFAPRSRELFFDPTVAVNPMGGCAGWQIPFRVTLDGYNPA